MQNNTIIEGKKKWATLNAHGKCCLKSFIFAISGTDLLTSQLDYLYRNDFVKEKINLPNWKEREEIAGYALTDLGVHTAAHYFPKFTDWDWKIKYLQIDNTLSKEPSSPVSNIGGSEIMGKDV
jgi:hypothetical protein